ncbi:MAG: hypothetical protein ACRDSL_18120 [Pseudonocardiaceae bacterium]
MQRSREVLAQRPPQRPPQGRPPPSAAAPRTRRIQARVALLAFTRQVLLRPTRIGTLALLGAMTSIVLVGAEGWWIVLGITLFQATAGMLTVVWVDIPPARPPRQAERLLADQEPAADAAPAAGPWSALDEIPRQRRPRPDE